MLGECSQDAGCTQRRNSSSQCQNGGGGKRKGAKRSKGSVHEGLGEKTLQGAVGWVRGWKSCHTGGVSTAVTVNREPSVVRRPESRYRSGLWGLCRPW